MLPIRDISILHLRFLKHNDYFHEYSAEVKPANKRVYTELRALLLIYLKCKEEPKITKYLRYISHNEEKNKDDKSGETKHYEKVENIYRI